MFDWMKERKEREKKLAVKNGMVEGAVEMAERLVKDERDFLRGLDNLMGASSPRFYSKETGSKLDEDRWYTEACLKYVVFDLEATRREREYLRELLDRAMEG